MKKELEKFTQKLLHGVGVGNWAVFTFVLQAYIAGVVILSLEIQGHCLSRNCYSHESKAAVYEDFE